MCNMGDVYGSRSVCWLYLLFHHIRLTADQLQQSFLPVTSSIICTLLSLKLLMLWYAKEYVYTSKNLCYISYDYDFLFH